MSLWKTNPQSCLESSRLLAQKIKEVGWVNLEAHEMAKARLDGIEICNHLPLVLAEAVASLLRITLPEEFSTIEYTKPQGKTALFAKMRQSIRIKNDSSEGSDA
jgi:hypothetical protein